MESDSAGCGRRGERAYERAGRPHAAASMRCERVPRHLAVAHQLLALQHIERNGNPLDGSVTDKILANEALET